MAYHLPHREHAGAKWLTVTLVSVYIIIAALVFVYGVENNNSKTMSPQSDYSKGNYSAKGVMPVLK